MPLFYFPYYIPKLSLSECILHGLIFLENVFIWKIMVSKLEIVKQMAMKYIFYPFAQLNQEKLAVD
ncbi:hypothetical protein D7283_06955 [Legionella pneumophila]|nr:hypothetical protein A6J41_004835 [Legionella pneumophila subsp. pneumophila]RDE53282.1 hypothetical protein DV939_13160 [Legionella pneumophila]RYB47081.1 hypothetical protein D7245_07360 [Legionella pneumophila]RYB51241.1 hypothetical protein D7230_00345 [Legionella pneumophila]RYB64786.1 hypothetical protein D7268_01910 [Legionella pneumophila]